MGLSRVGKPGAIGATDRPKAGNGLHARENVDSPRVDVAQPQNLINEFLAAVTTARQSPLDADLYSQAFGAIHHERRPARDMISQLRTLRT